MGVYDKNGNALTSCYDKNGNALSIAYDKNGNVVFNSGDEPFVPTVLPYTTNWRVTSNLLANAETQRNAIKAIYDSSNDAIPFFIQTDGHGAFNEYNKMCHNLAESDMEYITNIMLGDYDSYYYDGQNPQNHTASSAGLVNYLPVMGNHEFMSNNSEDAELADLSVLVPSYTPTGAILGSQTYGYYKYLDDKHNVKYLVGQPHIPDSAKTAGFDTKFTSDQWQWFINELALNDGYDVVILNHEPFGGTYHRVEQGDEYTRSGGDYNLTPILMDRKAKRSGTFTDGDGNTYNYDFTSCQSDLLCVMHGHTHTVEYIAKDQLGYPVYIERNTTNSGYCSYGIIDRAGGYMYIYRLSTNGTSNPIALEL